MHCVVAMAMPKQMQPQRQAETETGTQATATAAVQSIVTRYGDDPHTREAWLITG